MAIDTASMVDRRCMFVFDPLLIVATSNRSEPISIRFLICIGRSIFVNIIVFTEWDQIDPISFHYMPLCSESLNNICIDIKIDRYDGFISHLLYKYSIFTMDLYYIISSDVYNNIVNYLDHRDVVLIYNMTKHLRLYDRNNYLASLVRCIEIAKEYHLSYYDHAILLNIALLKGEICCIDYIFCKANKEDDLILDGELLRKTINNLRMQPINADIPIDIYEKYSVYYASKIQRVIETSQANILCIDMAVNGFYTTHSVLCAVFNRKTGLNSAKLVTNVISKMDPVAMRMIQMDKYLQLEYIGNVDIARCVKLLGFLSSYPGGIPWFNWIKYSNGVDPMVNESIFIFLQCTNIRILDYETVQTIKDIQKLAKYFKKYNVYDDKDYFLNADYPLDGLFHLIDLEFLCRLEEEIDIKRDVNLTSFFSTVNIDRNLIKYLEENYNTEFRYVKVPDMSIIEKEIIIERLTYLSRMGGKSRRNMRYLILKLLIFAYKNNVDYIYLDSIISHTHATDNIKLYIINTMVYQQEIITMGYHKRCCPAIGLKNPRQIIFHLNTV